MAGHWKDARGITVTTTPTLAGQPIQPYLAMVTGKVIGDAGAMVIVSASGNAAKV